MANKYARWTKEEDEILVQAIQDNPHNKAQAFRTTSIRLNRDIKSCSNRWYQALSNPESRHYVGCMFTLIGVSSHLDNRTTNRENARIIPSKTNKSIWSKIKRLLGL